MTTEPLETITKSPLTAEIYQDEGYNDSPDDWGNKNLFLVGFHRDFTVERDGFSKEVCQSIANQEDYPDYKAEADEIKKKYHTFGLEAYIHSGVVLALSNEGNFPDRQWDVSQIGLVFVAKSEARTKAKARTLALSIIETWNQYLAGEIYGYSISSETDEDWGGSCWGFYGLDSVREEAQSALDYAWKKYQKEREAKKKEEIRHRVPLQHRTASAF